MEEEKNVWGKMLFKFMMSVILVFFLGYIIWAIALGILFVGADIIEARPTGKGSYEEKINENMSYKNEFTIYGRKMRCENKVSLIRNGEELISKIYRNVGEEPHGNIEKIQLKFSTENYKVFYLTTTRIYDDRDSKSIEEENPIIIFGNGEVKSYTNESNDIDYSYVFGDEEEKYESIKMEIALNEIRELNNENLFFDSYKYIMEKGNEEMKGTVNELIDKYISREMKPTKGEEIEDIRYEEYLNSLKEIRNKFIK